MPIKKILVVDDSPTERHIITQLLESAGYEVSTAEGGDEGVERAKQIMPDLGLMDVVMPGMDGPATLVQLRQDPDTAAIPVVFLTANTDPKEIAHYRSLGAVDVIAKPYNPMTLAEQVRQVWAGHHA